MQRGVSWGRCLCKSELDVKLDKKINSQHWLQQPLPLLNPMNTLTWTTALLSKDLNIFKLNFNLSLLCRYEFTLSFLAMQVPIDTIPIQLCLCCLSEVFLLYCTVVPDVILCLQFETPRFFCTRSAVILELPSSTEFLNVSCQRNTPIVWTTASLAESLRATDLQLFVKWTSWMSAKGFLLTVESTCNTEMFMENPAQW